ncbi:hypothetical protein [Fischerella thermalis]|uniref:hypothetical protein n=1 Tax=Fischerella thermalis TaxID=372787 RepID=UPI0015E1249E|nr:hypothetical protein [Fischerella thermalis]
MMKNQSLEKAKNSIPSYRTPQLLVAGTAVELVRNSSGGHLKDGTGGWWVWGS